MLKCSALGLIIAVSLFFFPSLSYEKVVGKDREETLFIKSLTQPAFREVVEKGCVSCHEGIEDINPKMTDSHQAPVIKLRMASLFSSRFSKYSGRNRLKPWSIPKIHKVTTKISIV